jgi:hypothetical protein
MEMWKVLAPYYPRQVKRSPLLAAPYVFCAANTKAQSAK